ncbi:Uncharacterised protein [uncultured archaeon]|nr:Uncharacterised protein [uncultured archaeon]
MKKKCLAIGIILLFVGASVIPSFARSISEKSPPILSQGGDHALIHIKSNDEFTSENGVTGGNGTASNPYLIENWVLTSNGSGQAILILDTTAYFIIRNCTIRGFEDGILFLRVANGAIEKTTIETTTAWDETGIIIENSHAIIITDNIINADITNLGLESVYNISIYGNIFTGWLVIGSGKNFIFSYNMIHDGSLHVWDNCILISNNIMTFIDIKKVLYSHVTLRHNYWGKPLVFPKVIYGGIYKPGAYYDWPWLFIDWTPAQEPYDIPKFV